LFFAGAIPSAGEPDLIKVSATLFAILACTAATAAGEIPTLELIMADADWIGNAPEKPWWADGGDAVYYEQKRAGEDIRDLYRLSLDTGDAEPVDRAEQPVDSGRDRVYSPRRAFAAWIDDGDVFVKRLADGRVKQVTRTVPDESSPVFGAGADRLFFQRDGQFYEHALESGVLRQVTDLRAEEDPDKPPEFDALRAQQLRTYDTVVEDKRRSDALKAADRSARSDRPPPVYLGSGYKVLSRHISPAGDRAALVVTAADAEGGRPGQMPNYVTEDGYVAVREVRTRVGRNSPVPQDLLLVSLADGAHVKLDLTTLPGMDSDPFGELRDAAHAWHVERGADSDEVAKTLEPPEFRSVAVVGLAWSPDGTQLAAQLLATDYKDRWLVTVAAESGEVELQHRLSDEAWINWENNEFGWLRDNRTLWFLSEESGYSHLYAKRIDQRRSRQLTRGSFVVREPAMDAEEQFAYVVANRAHPGNYEIYRVPLSGGQLEQVTDLDGVSVFELSPDGRQVLVSRSAMDRHADLYLGRADGAGELRRLTDTVSERFAEVDWIVPGIVEVPSSAVERPIYSKLYLPRDFDPERAYPAVMFVHGAGYTQNVHMGWPYYFREFMFHTVLADAGYVVLDMDYRASRGYGRDWRTAIYRNMGQPELEDYLDGIEYLVRNYSVDRGRIGIYGGSYGGFLTFMALFRAPEVFAAGAALRPVVDWMHYNDPYTARILNPPVIDPEAYQRSSPINHAAGLQSPLLIAVGMQDDNVFFQDSVLLVQRLIELRKEHFEIAIYPLDAHSFVHPDSWLDEYRRIFRLMEKNLK
jgi:dipeptidyl aminopeptidase/acylaminoacyl peptidase